MSESKSISGSPVEYRLVIFDAINPEELPDVRQSVATCTGLHPTDVTQWLGRMPGLWPQPMREDQVRPLLDLLYDQAVAAEAWRNDLVPRLNPPRTVSGVACQDSGLEILGLHGEPAAWIPWGKVELVDAGWIANTESSRSGRPPGWVDALSIGLNALRGRAPRAAKGHPQPKRSTGLEKEYLAEAIVVRNDPRVAYRLREDQMHFRGIAEARSTMATENFPVVAEQIYLHAPDAQYTQGAKALTARAPGSPEEQPPDLPIYPSSTELLNHATLQLLWFWYCRDRQKHNEQADPFDEPPAYGSDEPFDTLHD